MSVYDYNETASSNTSAGGVNIAEGCAPAGINDAIRAVMADLAQKLADEGGAKTTTNVSNAYSLSTSQSFSAYSDGLFLVFRADAENTGAATLNVDSLGAKDIYRQSASGGEALKAGDIQEDGVYAVSYNSTDGRFFLLNPAPSIAGDWTPVVADADTGGNTATGTFSGRYVTDGKSVTVFCTLTNIDTTGMTGANVLYVRGLPFARTSETGAAANGSTQVTQCTYTATPIAWLPASASALFFRSAVSSGVPSTLKVNELTSGSSDLYFTLTYERA
jgi:hypothetical protein